MSPTSLGKTIVTIACLTLILVPAMTATASVPRDEAAPGPDYVRIDPVEIAGLQQSVRIRRDHQNVPHIFALNEHDALFMLGWVHSQDRFFQMDTLRRTFSGTLASLVGAAALGTDVQLRTLGLRRAAEATEGALTDETLAAIEAYAAGVNAYLASAANPLPPEYTALLLTKAGVPAWTAVDTLVIGKGLAFGLSFDLDDLGNTEAVLTFSGLGGILGFDGFALFFEDLYRSASFDPTVSIPGFLDGKAGPRNGEKVAVPRPDPKAMSYLDGAALELIHKTRAEYAKIPALARHLSGRNSPQGSNWWVASGAVTESGYPMLANDPHLGLDTPSTFYEVQMRVSGLSGGKPMNVIGVSFPGTAGVILGCNPWICWGATVNPMDVTDIYLEEVQLDPLLGLPVATTFDGQPEPLLPIPQTYFVNALNPAQPDTVVDSGIGITDPGGLTLIVPRRNNGPIINLAVDPGDPTRAAALSVQYTGWGPTRELEAIRGFARARSIDEFVQVLQLFDVGSQNFSVADVNGDIAYFTSAELPIREDLQNLNFPDGGIPPFFVRDGTHTLAHEWMPVTNPQPDQVLPFEILPFAEMPQVWNPESGYVLNCNNDPVGTTVDNNALNQVRPGGGIYYLNPGYATGLRMGRLQRLFDQALSSQGGPSLSLDDFKAFQANNQLLDAEVFVPYLLTAFANATADGAPAALADLGTDPGIAEAIGRLMAWDFSTPTGIPEGYDPGDDPADLPMPDDAEIAASVAATVYSTWRGQAVQATIDAALQRLEDARGNLDIEIDAPALTSLAPGSSLALAALRNQLDNFDTQQGFGASGVSFFEVQGIDDRTTVRDVVLLQALGDALDLLASDAFAEAFNNSTEQDDYRWGYLHRIVFDHILGGPFNVPASGGVADLSEELRGVARSGGLGALDASSHSARADGVNEFMFGSGPARRFVGVMAPSGPQVEEVIPGGESGVLGSPFQGDQLQLWLTNDYKRLYRTPAEVVNNTSTYQRFLPKSE